MVLFLTVTLTVLLVVALALCGLLGYRLGQLRRAGTPVLLRDLPAGADEGWRHGSVHYSDDALRYFRLSSLRPGPTTTFDRQAIEIVGRRAPEGTEREIMDGMVILELAQRPRGERESGGPVTPMPASPDHELAMSQGGVTAFQSWLESRQSDRSLRRRSA